MAIDEQKLINQIHRAFSGVRLDDGISLNMTEYYDSGGCMPEFKERAARDERDDWAAISSETLKQFMVTFSFTDLKGFRFYIPAYMVWTIQNHSASLRFVLNLSFALTLRPSRLCGYSSLSDSLLRDAATTLL